MADAQLEDGLKNSSSTGFRSRRRFLKQVSLLAGGSAAARAGASALLPAPPAVGARPLTVPIKNGKGLAGNVFYPLSVGSVRPRGWLLEQLKIQANGLGGHLDETWKDVGPESGWLGGKGESWERGPYFLDGLLPLAYLLDDPALKAKAQRFIDWTLASSDERGFFGPKSNDDWWPRMVMLKVLCQYQEVTNDPRVIPLMERYYAFQRRELPRRPLRDWGKFRWQDNVLCVLWLYNRNGDAKLLELAELLRHQGYDWQKSFADFKYTQPITAEYIKLDKGEGLSDLALATHGVNNGQALKASPVAYLVSKTEQDRGGLAHQLAMLDQYHGLPNGMFSCDEHLAGRNPSQGSELCTVVETMFSLEQSLAILGDARLGDRLEKIAYNALPGTFTDDMWAHQYNQEPNQVEVSLHRKPWTTDGPESNLYGLEPNFGCCTANFHQGWPKLANSTFMLSADDGLAATVYAPCEIHTSVRGVAVHLVEETEYPFRDTVRITVNPSASISFPLHLRVPEWAEGTTIRVNGKPDRNAKPGNFAAITRTWQRGDVVEISFPMTPRSVPGFRDSVSWERGPLVFSYAIGTDWLKLRDRGLTADWQVYPTTQWNYALALAAEVPAVTQTPRTGGGFTQSGTSVKLTVKGRKLASWRAEDGVAAPVPQSPVSSDEKLETLELIPYGAAKLRITSFPVLKT